MRRYSAGMNIVEIAHAAREVFPTAASLAVAREKDAAADDAVRDDDDDYDADDAAAGGAGAAAAAAAAAADDGSASPPVHGQLPFPSPKAVTEGWATPAEMQREYDSVTRGTNTKHPKDLVIIGAQEAKRVNGAVLGQVFRSTKVGGGTAAAAGVGKAAKVARAAKAAAVDGFALVGRTVVGRCRLTPG